MTRRRWIADEILEKGAALTGQHARHLGQVLRARVGQEFEISTGSEIRLAQITSISPERVEFSLGAIVSQAAQSVITVALSIFKFDRMEWAIEKCTELGVARLVPVIAGRTELHLARTATNRVERWKRIAQAASEQSRRISSPEISQPVKVKELIASVAGHKVVLSEVEDELMLKHAIPSDGSTVTLAFGPEGGWKQEELDAFGAGGWTAASLGSTILRVETAVIAAVAIASSVLQK
ncbi:MAG TPA: RsmE family RNA methyltransferase [Terriglobales bacterium]|jgi:16S rRNA (uracil1498-N3)-methyltransferase|nr:RsmE family RNA methyltransferase [Terriglobales bacterium]